MRRSNLQRNIQARADANLASVAARWQPFIEDFIRRYNIQDPRIIENLRGEWTRRAMAEPTVRFGNTDPNEPKLLDYLSRVGWQPGQQQPAPAAHPNPPFGVAQPQAAQASGIAAINQAQQQNAPVPPSSSGTPPVGAQPPSKDIIKQAVNEHPRLPGESDDAYRKRLEDLIGRGTRGPVTPQDPRAIRQALINRIVNQIPKKYDVGETNEEYADRIRPSITDAFKKAFGMQYNNFMMDWGGMGEGYRGPITPEEIAIAEQQPDVQRRLAWQHQQRLDRLGRERAEQEERQRKAQAAYEAKNKPVTGKEGEPELSWKEKMLKNVREAEEKRRASAQTEKPAETTKPAEKAAETTAGTSKTPPDGGDTPPGGGTSAEANQLGNKYADRMSDLLGQIRRTHRRATPTELNQIRDLYTDMSGAFGGNIPAGLDPVVNRIKRDFNTQANLLNVRGIDEKAPDRNLAQQMGVPLDAQGNVNMETYRTQFPQFFNNDERAGLLTEDQIPTDQKPLYRKIRSDINNMRWSQGMGEQGYATEYDKKGNLKYPNRKDEMEHYKRQDAQFRASDEYKNTPIPAGVVTQQARAQQPGTPSYFDEDTPYQTEPVNAAKYQQPAQTATQTSGTTQYPTVNVSATTGNQPIDQVSNAPLQSQEVGKKLGKVGQLWLGGNTQLLQVPQYTPWQRDLIREMGTMGMESLRQAYQPLDAPERQQAMAQTAMNSILERLQNNDEQGARQELIQAGGLGNLQAALNGMPSQPIGQAASATGQQQQAAATTAQPVAPMDRPQILAALREMQRIDDRAFQEGGVEGARAYTAQEQQRFNELYTQVSGQNPQALAGFQEQLTNFRQRFTGQPNIPQPAQPQTFDNRPAAGVLPRARQGLAQAAGGVQGVEKMQGGVGNIRNATQNFTAGFKEAWAQPGITPALDFLTQRGGQFGRGVGELFGGGSDLARSGQNIVNLAQGRPMQPGAPVPPGTPGAGGGAPVPPQGGGYGALGLVNRGGGYGHPMPYTAANEMQRFYEDTVPTLAERFTQAGGGQRSAAFQGALGRASSGLGLGLGALGEQQQLQQQQQAFNQQQTQREFDALQRQRQQQLQRQDQAFAFNRGTAMVNPALQQLNSQTILPGSPGILPATINATGQAINAGVKVASMVI